MSGRGIGVVCALFAAIDAGAKTWEDGGVWRRKPPSRIYQWRPPLQWAGALALAAVGWLAFPLWACRNGSSPYLLSFLFKMCSLKAAFDLERPSPALVRYA